MSLILGLHYEEQLPNTVRDELRQLVASLQTWANRELGGGAWNRMDPIVVWTSGATSFASSPGRLPYFKYQRTGNRVDLHFNILGVVTGAVLQLNIDLPLELQAVDNTFCLCAVYDAGGALASVRGTVIRGDFGANPRSATYLQLDRLDGAVFGAGVQISVAGQMSFEVR